MDNVISPNPKPRASLSQERTYQAKLIKRLKGLGFIVWKNQQNATTSLGRPDLLLLKGHFWACLEVKRTRTARHRPLQDVVVANLGKMSFASFIYPENEEEVIAKLLKEAEKYA